MPNRIDNNWITYIVRQQTFIVVQHMIKTVPSLKYCISGLSIHIWVDISITCGLRDLFLHFQLDCEARGNISFDHFSFSFAYIISVIVYTPEMSRWRPSTRRHCLFTGEIMYWIRQSTRGASRSSQTICIYCTRQQAWAGLTWQCAAFGFQAPPAGQD